MVPMLSCYGSFDGWSPSLKLTEYFVDKIVGFLALLTESESSARLES